MLSIEGSCHNIERNRSLFSNLHHNGGNFLLFGLVIIKEPFYFIKETSFFLFLLCFLDPCLSYFFVLFHGRGIGLDLSVHQVSLIFCLEEEADYSAWILKDIKSRAQQFITLCEAVIEFSLKYQAESLYIIEAKHFSFEGAIHIQLQQADTIGVAEFSFRISSIEGNNG